MFVGQYTFWCIFIGSIALFYSKNGANCSCDRRPGVYILSLYRRAGFALGNEATCHEAGARRTLASRGYIPVSFTLLSPGSRLLRGLVIPVTRVGVESRCGRGRDSREEVLPYLLSPGPIPFARCNAERMRRV